MEIKVTVDLSDRTIEVLKTFLSGTSAGVCDDPIDTCTVDTTPPEKPKKPKAKKASEAKNPTPTATTPAVPEAPAMEVSPTGLVTGTSVAPPLSVDIPPATETTVTRNTVIQSLTRLAPAGYTNQCKAAIQKYSTNERKDLAGVPVDQLAALNEELNALGVGV